MFKDNDSYGYCNSKKHILLKASCILVNKYDFISDFLLIHFGIDDRSAVFELTYILLLKNNITSVSNTGDFIDN
ncbi:hypothetical protein [Clostridium butyricum]|uniref:hypothetical protein n=1 Tax=Clostridium butyricum TaxID=1492 RepID=UPI0018A89A8D|nr:hypothetical protein [Clostridium butyricum]